MINNFIRYRETSPFRARPRRWWVLAMVVLMLDVTSKAAISTLMTYGASIPLTDYFNIVHARNTGAAFSFLADAGGWQRYFFIALAFGVSMWLALELRKPLPALSAWAYSLILGGALGNAIDRLLHGYVVDYLDFHVGGWHWPAFNAADIGIVCGAVLLVIENMRPTVAVAKEKPKTVATMVRH
ncbi:signal peptidase II [Herminiimonas arsenitoxidans]|uniref:signal peptidase II n=1 Tax=Herminiimonas arsenitoxidans TaxID=1809410 RepID=UPI00097042DC|nr:signal peptidase II [Herminiimonas arsenitoxidans]